MFKALLYILGCLLAAAVVFTIASARAESRLRQTVTKEVAELFRQNGDCRPEIVQLSDLTKLPPCVQNWLNYSQIVGKEKIRTARLKQKGQMRLKPDGAWMSAEAEQYFTTDQPGFVWTAVVKMAPLHFTGRDKYAEGHGSMLIRLFSIFPVAAASGKEMDQGALLRYLAEMQWFPSAALNRYIQWEEIDSFSAKATMSDQGVTASGVLHLMSRVN